MYLSWRNYQENLLRHCVCLSNIIPLLFFDIIFHLTIHLIREVRLGESVCFHWMYPFERLMKLLKGYVRNQNQSKGYIIESYIAEEAIELLRVHF